MSIEDELLGLARERETKTENDLAAMLLGRPNHLLRQLRAYLSRQVDHARMKHTNEKIPQLATVQDGINQLTCADAEFSSGARLTFDIQLEEGQRGWLVKSFHFRVRLPHSRPIQMIQIHLNADASLDPLKVPRCHMQVGNGRAHVPFPVMDPRLILHLICEHVEPDFVA